MVVAQNLIVALEDYEKDINSINPDLSTNFNAISSKLNDILNFINLEPVLSSEYDKRVNYFTGLLTQENFTNLRQKLKNKTIYYLESISIIKPENIDYEKWLKDLFPDYSYYLENADFYKKKYKVNYKANDYEKFLKILNIESLWEFHSGSFQLELDFSMNIWKGFSDVNYNNGGVSTHDRILGDLKIPPKDNEFEDLLNKYSEITEITPKRLKVRQFQSVAALKVWLKNYRDMSGCGFENYEGNCEELFTKEKTKERLSYLIEVIRELKYYLLESVKTKSDEQQEQKSNVNSLKMGLDASKFKAALTQLEIKTSNSYFDGFSEEEKAEINKSIDLAIKKMDEVKEMFGDDFLTYFASLTPRALIILEEELKKLGVDLPKFVKYYSTLTNNEKRPMEVQEIIDFIKKMKNKLKKYNEEKALQQYLKDIEEAAPKNQEQQVNAEIRTKDEKQTQENRTISLKINPKNIMLNGKKILTERCCVYDYINSMKETKQASYRELFKTDTLPPTEKAAISKINAKAKTIMGDANFYLLKQSDELKGDLYKNKKGYILNPSIRFV